MERRKIVTKFLIASHGKLAEGLYDTFVMVMGKNENLSFLSLYKSGRRYGRKCKEICGWNKGRG